jgi:hypothetical protein
MGWSWQYLRKSDDEQHSAYRQCESWNGRLGAIVVDPEEAPTDEQEHDSDHEIDHVILAPVRDARRSGFDDKATIGLCGQSHR